MSFIIGFGGMLLCLVAWFVLLGLVMKALYFLWDLR
jgi:hypothetical protein